MSPRKKILWPWLLLTLAAAGGGGVSDIAIATSTAGADAVPARSMHRLVTSVVDDVPPPPPPTVANTSSVQGRTGHSSYSPAASKIVDSDRFTPSYFLGEVIPEPYVPDRFQHSRVDRNSSSSRPAPSQSAGTSRTVPVGRHTQNNRGGSGGGFFPSAAAAYVPPVREESAEDAPAAGCCRDEDRPRGLHSTRPVTFEDDLPEQQHTPRDQPYPFDIGGPHQSGLGADRPERYEPSGADDLALALMPSPFHHHHQLHHTHAHYNQVYQHAQHQHQHLRQHQQQPGSSPLVGLLRAAAALLPVGLLVASLYPNVVHVNATDTATMPMKQRRSLDGGEDQLMARVTARRRRRRHTPPLYHHKNITWRGGGPRPRPHRAPLMTALGY